MSIPLRSRVACICHPACRLVRRTDWQAAPGRQTRDPCGTPRNPHEPIRLIVAQVASTARLGATAAARPAPRSRATMGCGLHPLGSAARSARAPRATQPSGRRRRTGLDATRRSLRDRRPLRDHRRSRRPHTRGHRHPGPGRPADPPRRTSASGAPRPASSTGSSAATAASPAPSSCPQAVDVDRHQRRPARRRPDGRRSPRSSTRASSTCSRAGRHCCRRLSVFALAPASLAGFAAGLVLTGRLPERRPTRWLRPRTSAARRRSGGRTGRRRPLRRSPISPASPPRRSGASPTSRRCRSCGGRTRRSPTTRSSGTSSATTTSGSAAALSRSTEPGLRRHRLGRRLRRHQQPRGRRERPRD